MRRIATAAAAAVLIGVAAASAQTPPAAGLVPPPPGSVVQNQAVAFNGESAKNQWHAVVSKKRVGSGNGTNFYQWYLSLYGLQRGAYRLRYQSPRNGGPLSHVEQANGAKMWFPVAQVRIVGAASLMHSGVQQLVVQSHEMAADCGGATVTIFATKPGGSIGAVATIKNPCDLNAKLGADGTSVELTGPYYKSDAPMCCPTKTNATAELRYSDGKWILSESYFKLE
ncbi:MAG: hypothetical protein WBE79_14715 [Candidatus Cybelea sp.]